jgi:hypothetical protein
VIENPWIQWCVLLPRELDGSEDVREVAARALDALGLTSGMTHMEWFRRPDGSLAVPEVAARPPGAQLTTLLSYAHELDFYEAWPRIVIENRFAAPARHWAAGAAYVRGQGSGRVRRIHGLDVARHALGTLVVGARLPAAGTPQRAVLRGRRSRHRAPRRDRRRRGGAQAPPQPDPGRAGVTGARPGGVTGVAAARPRGSV